MKGRSINVCDRIVEITRTIIIIIIIVIIIIMMMMMITIIH